MQILKHILAYLSIPFLQIACTNSVAPKSVDSALAPTADAPLDWASTSNVKNATTNQQEAHTPESQGYQHKHQHASEHKHGSSHGHTHGHTHGHQHGHTSSHDNIESYPEAAAVRPEKHGKKNHHSHDSEGFFQDAMFADLQAKTYHNIYLTGEASPAALKEMAKAGIKAYIDIRPESEVTAEFKSLVSAAGLEFYSVPVFLTDGSIDYSAVDKVFELHRKFHGVGHAVACGSGVRSSGWMTLHLNRHHKMPMEKAIEIGKQAYLKDSLAEKIMEASK